MEYISQSLVSKVYKGLISLLTGRVATIKSKKAHICAVDWQENTLHDAVVSQPNSRDMLPPS